MNISVDIARLVERFSGRRRQTFSDYLALRQAADKMCRHDPRGQLAYMQARSDPRFAVLALCEISQYEAHLHLGDEPVCINPAGVDYLWRAVLMLVRDGPQCDDDTYRYVMENLQPMSQATLRHRAAAPGRR